MKKDTTQDVKEKVLIEYNLNASSKVILWDAISTKMGLEDWFADEVQSDGKIYTFKWGKVEERKAEMQAIRLGAFIRFKWLDESEYNTFFEFRIHFSELTHDFALEITDFCEPGESADLIELWNSQVDTLRRACGM